MCEFRVVPPVRPSHSFYVEAGEREVNVYYFDGPGLGPAEQTFLDLDDDGEVAAGILSFLNDLVEGRVVVVRKRRGGLARIMRRDRISFALFEAATDLAKGDPAKLVAVYHWNASDELTFGS